MSLAFQCRVFLTGALSSKIGDLARTSQDELCCTGIRSYCSGPFGIAVLQLPPLKTIRV